MEMGLFLIYFQLMNNNLDFILNEQIQINLITFVEGLVLAAFLSLLIQITYIKFSNALSNKLDFSKNLSF